MTAPPDLAPGGFIARHGLVQYGRTRRGRYARRGPCELGLHQSPAFPLVFDHCALHGWVRGVICQGCNMRLPVEWRVRDGRGPVFACAHRHLVQVSVIRCRANLERRAAPWLRIAAYLANCPGCTIPEVIVRWPVLAGVQ